MVGNASSTRRVVLCVFACELVAIGSTSYSFGLFVGPVSEELGLSRGTANLGMVALMLGMALASPLAGWLLDRHAPGKLICIGTWLAGLGMLAIAASPNAVGIAAALLLLVGPGVSLFGPAAGSTIINRNVFLNRGRALGFASLGASFGGIVIVPLVSLYILLLDWRAAIAVHALTISVLLPALVYILLKPSGKTARPESNEGQLDASVPVQSSRSLLATRKFWMIAGAVALVFSASQAVLISLVPYAMSIGVSAMASSTLVSVVAFSSMLGKLLFGFFLDRFVKKWILAVVIFLVIVQLAVLLLASNYWVLLVLLLLTGLAVGGELPVWAAITADYFRLDSIGWVMGAMNLLNMVSNMVVIYGVGVLYDRSGSYASSFLLLIGLLLAALLLCLLIPALKRGQVAAGG